MLIGLHGYPGVGKDQIATLLAPLGFERVSFGDSVRAGLLGLDPYLPDLQERLSIAVATLGWDRVKRESKEVRELLQRYGTEAGRQIHGHDCWLQIALRKIRSAHERGKKVVVTDVRFDNEARLLVRDLGPPCGPGVIFEVVRPGFGPVNQHASEQRLDPRWIAGTIENSGSVADLRERVIAAVCASK